MPGARSEEQIAAKLDRLATRREHQQHVSKTLADEIRDAVAEAQDVMTVAEIARRLGIDRSTLYRVYLAA
jgi:DNA invertase Pin-like site-specific DNA recombinase